MIGLYHANLCILWAQSSLTSHAMQELKEEQERHAKLKAFAKTQVSK